MHRLGDSPDLPGTAAKGQRQRHYPALRAGSGFALSPPPPSRGAGPVPFLRNPDLHEGLLARPQGLAAKPINPRGLPREGKLGPLRRSQGIVLFLTIPGPRTNPCGHPWPKPRRPWARWFAPSEGSWLERSKCTVPATFLAMTSPRGGAGRLPHTGTFRPFQPLQSQGCNQRDEGRRGWRNAVGVRNGRHHPGGFR